MRNDRPFLLIPYEHEGAQHHYEPDYIVKFRNGLMVLLEMKGAEFDMDHAKYRAALRWVSAVNNWGRLGRWILWCAGTHSDCRGSSWIWYDPRAGICYDL